VRGLGRSRRRFGGRAAELAGDARLSIRSDEAEESWRVVTPVLDAWSKDLVPLEDYPAGSQGPGTAP